MVPLVLNSLEIQEGHYYDHDPSTIGRGEISALITVSSGLKYTSNT